MRLCSDQMRSLLVPYVCLSSSASTRRNRVALIHIRHRGHRFRTPQDPQSGSPFPISSSLVHATRHRVKNRATKAGNVKRRTESQKVAEILRRKSTARISACLTALRGKLLHLEILLQKSTVRISLISSGYVINVSHAFVCQQIITPCFSREARATILITAM